MSPIESFLTYLLGEYTPLLDEWKHLYDKWISYFLTKYIGAYSFVLTTIN